MNQFIIKILFLIAATVATIGAKAQTAADSTSVLIQDSAYIAQQTMEIEKLLYEAHVREMQEEAKRQLLYEGEPTPRFSIKQAILPTALVAVGAMALCDNKLKQFNRHTYNNFTKPVGNIEDYLQFAPFALNIGMTLAKAESKYSTVDNLLASATSIATMYALTGLLKVTTREPRPYNPDIKNSFPSGHVARAFRSAELTRIQYGNWWGLGSYALATSVAYFRLRNGKHWASDIVAGMGIGILSARLGYWLVPLEKKLFGLDKKQAQSGFAAVPFYEPNTRSMGAAVAIVF